MVNAKLSTVITRFTKTEQETIKFVLNGFDDMKKLANKPYRFLGDRTPLKYWDDQEKRFLAYSPPKDIDSNEWQANLVMGITRNAVLGQIGKTGMRVPECRIQSWSKDGFVDTERSRIWQNSYRWSLRRENADWLQQFVSLGNYVRGNACVYEGFEDKEIEMDMVTDWDSETGEVLTEKGKVKKWGPKRQIVPLDEIYFPNYYKQNLKQQSRVIWARIEDYDSLKYECEGYKNWKKIKPGLWNVPDKTDPFFRPREVLGENQVFVIRDYGNPFSGGDDRFVLLVNGVPLYDNVIPFNSKRPPFGWSINEPFSDSFMLGCGIPWKMMEHQDLSDAVMNMGIDKNTMSMQKPIMTDDPDARISNLSYPGAIMKFTRGSKWDVAPLEGVTSGEFNFLQMCIQQAKEFSGTFGGGNAMTAKGGKVTARQAIMLEEDIKRQLGISMSNLEHLEREICIIRLHNLRQKLAASGETLTVDDVDLYGGKRGRFVMYLAKTTAEAEKIESEDGKLSTIEMAGMREGVQTEAIAVSPEWLELDDRLEAECVPESSYQRNSVLEQAVSDERLIMFGNLKAFVPSINMEEMVRENMKKHGEDSSRFIISGEGMQQQLIPPNQPGLQSPELASQVGAMQMNKSAGKMTGTEQ